MIQAIAFRFFQKFETEPSYDNCYFDINFKFQLILSWKHKRFIQVFHINFIAINNPIKYLLF